MPTTTALKLFDAWNAALEANDPEKLADLYAPDAVLVPTLSARIRTDRTGLLDYFRNFTAKKLRSLITESHVLDFGDIQVHSGLYSFSPRNAGATPVADLEARFTFVYRRTGGEWKIVSHHSSLKPTS